VECDRSAGESRDNVLVLAGRETEWQSFIIISCSRFGHTACATGDAADREPGMLMQMFVRRANSAGIVGRRAPLEQSRLQVARQPSLREHARGRQEADGGEHLRSSKTVETRSGDT
jgi:hypothetical protein